MTPLRAILAPTLAALPLVALGLGLGTWQLQRKAEKEALIAAVETRAMGAPTTIPAPGAWALLDPDKIDFQKVSVEGRFRPDAEFRLYAVLNQPRGPLGGAGWFVYQPFALANGGTILVNRGFVPEAMREVASRPARAAAPEGSVRIEGLVRRAERPGWFAAADDPARNQWFTRDPAKMAAHAGLGPVASFTLEQTSPNPGDLPQAGEIRLRFPNRHLEYAGTWFGLTLTLVGVWAVFVARRLKLAATPAPR